MNYLYALALSRFFVMPQDASAMLKIHPIKNIDTNPLSYFNLNLKLFRASYHNYIIIILYYSNFILHLIGRDTVFSLIVINSTEE